MDIRKSFPFRFNVGSARRWGLSPSSREHFATWCTAKTHPSSAPFNSSPPTFLEDQQPHGQPVFSIHRMLCKAGVECTEDDVDRWILRYFDIFSGFAQFRDQTLMDAKTIFKHGWAGAFRSPMQQKKAP
jgi:hypothetical protein